VHLVVAPDKFRGTATAAEVADRIRTTATALGWTCTAIPLADGGEGTLDAFGGGNRSSAVTGPLGERVDAAWRFAGGTAVIEMATASGLALVGGHAYNDPMAATSRGTGELIRQAARAGARRIVVAAGGSACTDGGLGAIEVIERLAPFGTGGNAHLVVAVDVWTTFDRAAEVYGPQKGATPEQVGQLKDRLDSLKRLYEQSYAVDLSQVQGSGAAGGLAGALAALGGQLVGGFDLVSAESGLPDAIAGADLVITGEGRLDHTSLQGKVVGGVLALASAASVPCAVIAGQVDAGVEVPARVVSLVDTYGYKCSWEETLACTDDATRRVISLSV
jgi:glycerate kinase